MGSILSSRLNLRIIIYYVEKYAGDVRYLFFLEAAWRCNVQTLTSFLGIEVKINFGSMMLHGHPVLSYLDTWYKFLPTFHTDPVFHSLTMHLMYLIFFCYFLNELVILVSLYLNSCKLSICLLLWKFSVFSNSLGEIKI